MNKIKFKKSTFCIFAAAVILLLCMAGYLIQTSNHYRIVQRSNTLTVKYQELTATKLDQRLTELKEKNFTAETDDKPKKGKCYREYIVEKLLEEENYQVQIGVICEMSKDDSTNVGKIIASWSAPVDPQVKWTPSYRYHEIIEPHYLKIQERGSYEIPSEGENGTDYTRIIETIEQEIPVS